MNRRDEIATRIFCALIPETSELSDQEKMVMSIQLADELIERLDK